MSVQILTAEYLADLVQEAESAPRLRQHRNLHTSYGDHSQRFLNAICINSYIRPHRHTLDPKNETLIAIRGLFALITFNDEGTIREVIRFGTERYSMYKNLGVGVDLLPGTWHTVLALKPASVLMEVKPGPFNPNAAKELAPWAPKEGTADASSYLEELHSLVGYL